MVNFENLFNIHMLQLSSKILLTSPFTEYPATILMVLSKGSSHFKNLFKGKTGHLHIIDVTEPGNVVVTNGLLLPNQVWIVLGDKRSVRNLLQNPIKVELQGFWRFMNALWRFMNVFAGISVYLYTIFTIFG